MKKVISALMLSGALFTGSALAAPIYYEATNVVGTGTIEYGYTPGTINDAPVFSFVGTSGTVSENLASYIPGDYTVSFYLDGLWVDANPNDGIINFSQAAFGLNPFSFTSGSVMLPALSLVDSIGPLSWNFVPNSGIEVSYDFGMTGAFTNMNVNQVLASADFIYSGEINGVMDASIGWDTLRVELNAVPEPATLLLFGIGLLGVGFKRRQMRA